MISDTCFSGKFEGFRDRSPVFSVSDIGAGSVVNDGSEYNVWWLKGETNQRGFFWFRLGCLVLLTWFKVPVEEVLFSHCHLDCPFH